MGVAGVSGTCFGWTAATAATGGEACAAVIFGELVIVGANVVELAPVVGGSEVVITGELVEVGAKIEDASSVVTAPGGGDGEEPVGEFTRRRRRLAGVTSSSTLAGNRRFMLWPVESRLMVVKGGARVALV